MVRRQLRRIAGRIRVIPRSRRSPIRYPVQPYQVPPPRTNWFAILSLVFGIIGMVPIGVICGIVGLILAKRGDAGRGMAIAGLVLSGLWLLPVVALIAYGLTFGRGTAGVEDLKVGDCLAEIPDSAQVWTVKTVACEEPHTGEVFAQVTVPDVDFPGQDAIIEEYEGRCEPELGIYSPAAAEDMSIALYSLYPGEETWDRGHRTVTCIAMTLPPRTGSIKG